MKSKLDFVERIYHGEVVGQLFSATASGVLICPRVPDVTRDEMRLAAADAFLSSARSMKLEKEEYRYWAGIRTLDDGHKSFADRSDSKAKRK